MSDRKVLVATYYHEDAFIIPKGVDLDDKSVVKEYYVKYNTLFIKYVDGREVTIESQSWDMDMKFPDETKICDAIDYCIDIADEDETDNYAECCVCQADISVAESKIYKDECVCLECYAKKIKEDKENGKVHVTRITIEGRRCLLTKEGDELYDEKTKEFIGTYDRISKVITPATGDEN